MERQLYTVKEVQEITGFSKVTLYRAISRQEIPTVKIGAAIRVPKTWVDQQILGHPAGQEMN
jgi:excisionase family DNA binding protein